MKLGIDGSQHTGQYRVDCECGDHWSGVAVRFTGLIWSPAMPIAECIAHMKLCHPEVTADVRFTRRFEQWLLQYWERCSDRQFAETETAI